MKEFKGTKGYWHLNSETPIKGKYAATELVINFDEHITSCVSVFCTIDEGSEEDLANAKLITASPELLEELIELREWVLSLNDWSGAGDPPMQLRSKAIEKALN